jgi:hypothetical protein
MTSVLNVDTIADKAGTGPVALTKQSAAKSWGHIDGTGTASLDGSFNVSTLTDVGTGQYKFTYTNSMNNDDYSVVYASSSQMQIITSVTTTTNQALNRNQSNTNEDPSTLCSTVNGDLA